MEKEEANETINNGSEDQKNKTMEDDDTGRRGGREQWQGEEQAGEDQDGHDTETAEPIT